MGKHKLPLFLFLVVTALIIFVPGKKVFADPPASIAGRWTSSCPAPGQPGQTVYGAYPSPSTLTSITNFATTNVYAAALLCSGAAPSQYPADEVHIIVTSFTNTNGTGATMGYPPFNGQHDYDLGDLTVPGTYTPSVGATVVLGNLRIGLNCFNINFYGHASYGGVVRTSKAGFWNFCVDFIQDRSPTLSVTPRCANQDFIFSTNDPDAGNYTAQYRVYQRGTPAPAYGAAFSVTNPTINRSISMSSRNQNLQWTIDIRTAGKIPAGTTPVPVETRSTTYGSCDIQPTGVLAPSCGGTARITATDPNHSPVAVELWINGPQGAPGASQVAPVSANSGQTYNISSYFDYNAHNYYAYAMNYDTSGTATGWVQVAVNRLVACTFPNCGVVFTPGALYPGSSFNATTTVTYSPGSNSPSFIKDTAFFMHTVVKQGASTIYDNLPSNTFIGYAAPSGQIDKNQNSGIGYAPPLPAFLTAGAVGVTYTVTTDFRLLTLAGSVTPLIPACSNNITVVVPPNTPYLRIYGGDISAGMRGSCQGWGPDLGTGNVRGFWGSTSGLPDVTKGSGAQLGIFALGSIDNSGNTGFSSAMLRAAAPVPALGLDFANTGAGTPGSFTADQWCGYDFYGNRTSTTPGPVTVPTTNVANGTKTTMYVNGNVIITGNVTYTNAGIWNALSQVASYVIIANGNIYIDQTVTQLDGTYIAEGGTLYTCTAGSLQIPDSNKFTDCNRQLIVNGSLGGRTIKWQRTYGTTTDAISRETLSTITHSCANTHLGFSATAVCASEVVNYGPEVYAVPGVIGYQYDYDTSLPPIL